MRDLEGNKQIEAAISFLVESINATGNNPKPVILHSIRVGNLLYDFGYAQDIVIAGFLHDVLEDSDVEFPEIKDKFGEQVALLVQANSFDKTITDKVGSYEELFDRCVKAEKEALVVKCADLYDNADYCLIDENGDPNNWWIEKCEYF